MCIRAHGAPRARHTLFLPVVPICKMTILPYHRPSSSFQSRQSTGRVSGQHPNCTPSLALLRPPLLLSGPHHTQTLTAIPSYDITAGRAWKQLAKPLVFQMRMLRLSKGHRAKALQSQSWGLGQSCVSLGSFNIGVLRIVFVTPLSPVFLWWSRSWCQREGLGVSHPSLVHSSRTGIPVTGEAVWRHLSYLTQFYFFITLMFLMPFTGSCPVDL